MVVLSAPALRAGHASCLQSHIFITSDTTFICVSLQGNESSSKALEASTTIPIPASLLPNLGQSLADLSALTLLYRKDMWARVVQLGLAPRDTSGSARLPATWQELAGWLEHMVQQVGALQLSRCRIHGTCEDMPDMRYAQAWRRKGLGR